MEGDNTNTAPETPAAAPTYEQLSDTLNATRDQLAKKSQDYEALNQKLQETQKAYSDLEQSHNEATKIISEQGEMIEAQDKQLTELQGKPASAPQFTFNKVTYLVSAEKFQYKRQEYTRTQLLTDKKLQAELVKAGVGFLTVKED